MSKVILLMNLGSPDSTSVRDVKKYLNEFLMDERVIDIPAWIRKILVKGIIVPFRSPKSAKAYQSIWTPEGSPLINLTYQLKEAVHAFTQIPVEVCMRYGNPTPQQTFDSIQKKYPTCNEVILFPLYPHYAMSSYETAVVYAQQVHHQQQYNFKLTTIPVFYEHPAYIHALSKSIEPYLKNNYDQIIFSYHGIPERHVKKTDTTKCHCLQQNNCCGTSSQAHTTCYRHQVFTTTAAVVSTLNIPYGKYQTTFQSRLGSDAWLKPYTADTLQQLPKKGIKKLIIVCPAFVSDCLETIEEIGEEGKEIFLEAGGESYTVIPCLNTKPLWIKAINTIINEHSSLH